MEPKPSSQKYQEGTSGASSSAGRPASARSAKHMTTAMISKLVQEFRDLQIEVTELKAAGRRVEKITNEEGAFRYQLYFEDGYEQQARKLMAAGLAAFL